MTPTAGVITGGAIQLNVDFGASSVNGSMTLTSNLGANYTAAASGAISIAGTFSGNSFTTALSGSGAVGGTLQGNFYGPIAGTASGTFNMSDPGLYKAANGTFSATRP